MKKSSLYLILSTLILCVCVLFSACRDNTDGGKDLSQGDILIVFFSRADENYSVGNIEKGNTQIIAEIIAEETGGDLFHIQRKTPYPSVYSECVSEARTEKNVNARPELLETKDISAYEVIFLGYPIWHGDMPMPVYTFIESNDWQGKTVIPFCTHEGSGLSGTVSSIQEYCAGAEVKTGLAIRGATAQNSTDEAKRQVLQWLEN